MMKNNHASEPVKAKALGRPRSYDLDEALDRAIDVFCERGYSGTSINALAEAMGLVTGSIYKAFKDKEAVFMAALQRYNHKNRVALQDIMAAETTGMLKLKALVALYVSVSHSTQGLRGCLVVTSTVELTTFSPKMVDLVEATTDGLALLIEHIVALGQKDGSITTHIEPKVAVSFILNYLLGMRVVGKLNPSSSELIQASELVVAVLKP